MQKTENYHRHNKENNREYIAHAYIISYKNGVGGCNILKCLLGYEAMKNFYKLLLIILGVMLGGLVGGVVGEVVYAESDVGEEIVDGEVEEIVINENIPEIFIKAINPGYTVDGKSNVGEMIEIGFRKEHPQDVISLASLSLSYTNSSGNESELMKFSEHLTTTSENIILRLASSEEAELANFNYTKTLAFQGGLTLKKDDEVLDVACWTGKEGCKKAFKSSSPTILVRNLKTGEFEHLTEYEPVYHADAVVDNNGGAGGVDAGEAADTLNGQCAGLVFSEILSYYAETQDEQFVELYNSGSEQILLDGCTLKYKNKYYQLSGILKAEEYYVRNASDFSLTKNPTNSNIIEIIDVNGAVVDKLEYPNGQRKGASYAFVGYDERGKEIWRVTYAVTRGEANNYQEYKTCEEGKVINETTGNCVKVATVAAEKTCEDGYYLNPLTGRCRKIEVVAAKTCKEGYYLNEETGRCRKIIENNGTTYALSEDEYKEETSFVAVYAIIGVLAAGIIYIIYEFRREISKLMRKVFRRAH